MHKYLSLLFCPLAMLLASCKPEMDFTEVTVSGQTKIVGTPSEEELSLLFPSDAGSATVNLEANRKWSASFVNERAKDWCSLSTDSGKRGTATITVYVKANTDYDQRSASIIFNCDGLERTIVVTQKQKDALLLSSTRQDVGKDGGLVVIEVKANIAYSSSVDPSAESWIMQIPTKGLTTSTISFQVAANEEVEKREGAITISSSLGQETVKVYQEGAAPTLIVSGNQVEMDPSGGTFQVEVRSNVDVSVGIPQDCDWVSEVTTKAMSTNTFVFEVENNGTFLPREAQLIFSNSQYKLKEALTVSQDGISQPGMYGIYGKDYVFSADGWNQFSRKKSADGQLTYFLRNAASLSVVAVSGIPNEAKAGARANLTLRLMEKGSVKRQFSFPAVLEYQTEDLLWYRVGEETCFVLTK